MRKWIFIMFVVLCGCIGQEKLTLTEITFCTNEPFDRSYEQNPDAIYMQGETVWIYFETFKFQYTEEERQGVTIYSASFDVKLEVYDDDGIIVLKGTQPIEVASADELVYVWFKFWIDTNEFEGVYTVKITVTDTLSEESAQTEGTFTVKSTA